MYCTPIEKRTARTKHKCTWCAEVIGIGATYERWCSFDEDAFTNKMHLECSEACHDELQDLGTDSYSAFSNERPKVESQEVTK